MEAILAENKARLMAMKRTWQAYHGEFPKPLKVKPGKPDDSVVTNFCRLIVNTTAFFLFGKEVVFELDRNTDEESPAERWLAQVWKVNHKMTTLLKVGINGAACGHVFVKVKRVPGRSEPRIINLDPAMVTPFVSDSDVDDVPRFRIEWTAPNPTTGKLQVFRQDVTRQDSGKAWDIVDSVSEINGRWTETGHEVWPYEQGPILHCQNLPVPNEFWGIPDVPEDVIDLNQAINFVLSNLQRIIRYHAHPKTWGKGFRADQLEQAADETLIINSPEGTLQNLEPGGDLTASVTYYNKLKEALHEIVKVPEVAMGKVESLGALSGFALQVLYRPLVELTETKRVLYGEMLNDLNRLLLLIGGYPEQDVMLAWPDVLPANIIEQAQVAQIDQALGVSKDTLLSKRGYDAELEAQKRQAERMEEMNTARAYLEQVRPTEE